MSNVLYYKPPTEDPISPDEAEGIAGEFSNFLVAFDRDASDEVARQNVKDKSEMSYRLWLQQKLEEIGISPPGSEYIHHRASLYL